MNNLVRYRTCTLVVTSLRTRDRVRNEPVPPWTRRQTRHHRFNLTDIPISIWIDVLTWTTDSLATIGQSTQFGRRSHTGRCFFSRSTEEGQNICHHNVPTAKLYGEQKINSESVTLIWRRTFCKLPGNLLNYVVCQHASVYGFWSNRFEVTAKRRHFKRLTLKMKVKYICDLAEVRR